MIKINLLSPWDKENLKWEKMNNLVMQGIVWIVIVEIFFVAMFFFSMEYLRIEGGSVSSQLANMDNQPGIKEVKNMEADIVDYSGKINSIYSLQKTHLAWTLLFDKISTIVPNDVRLDSISVQEFVPPADVKASKAKKGKNDTADDKKKFIVEVVGKAKTRDDLLSFEKNLKNCDMFSELAYDDSNYVKSVDINFKYTFYVYAEKILQ
jgi:Tfp pilus assembly protein PilN